METKREPDPGRPTDDGAHRGLDESDPLYARILSLRTGEPIEGALPTSPPWSLLAKGEAGDPGRDLEEEEENKVWVGHRAFDELLDCAEQAEEEGEATG